MPRSERVTEWGGVSVDFRDGESTRSIAFLKEDRCFKLSAPDRKGAFDVDKIVAIRYVATGRDQGRLIVVFDPSIKGVKDGIYEVGTIAKEHWAVFKRNLEGWVQVNEE